MNILIHQQTNKSGDNLPAEVAFMGAKTNTNENTNAKIRMQKVTICQVRLLSWEQIQIQMKIQM